MHRNRGVPEVYENFHALAFGASGEIQEWMFVELELRKDAFEPRIGWVAHTAILTGVAVCVLERRSSKWTGQDFKNQLSDSSSRFSGLHSYLKASMGSSFAALMAGNMPLMIPTKLRIAVDQMRVVASIARWMSPSSAPSWKALHSVSEGTDHETK